MPKTSRIEDISPQLSRRLGGESFGESSDHISRIPHPSLYCPERNAAFSKICGKKDQVCGRVREGRDFPFVLDNEGGSRTKKEGRSRFLSPSPFPPPFFSFSPAALKVGERIGASGEKVGDLPNFDTFCKKIVVVKPNGDE